MSGYSFLSFGSSSSAAKAEPVIVEENIDLPTDVATTVVASVAASDVVAPSTLEIIEDIITIPDDQVSEKNNDVVKKSKREEYMDRVRAMAKGVKIENGVEVPIPNSPAARPVIAVSKELSQTGSRAPRNRLVPTDPRKK